MDLSSLLLVPNFVIFNELAIKLVATIYSKESRKLTISKFLHYTHPPLKKKKREREFQWLGEVELDSFKTVPRGILIKRVLKKNTCCNTVEERPRREKMGGGKTN